MPGNIPNIYPLALRSRLSKISLTRRDVQRGELDFKELFFPLQIDEGKYAFRGHASQMERASRQRRDGSETQGETPKARDLDSVVPDTDGRGPLEHEDLYPTSSLITLSPSQQASRVIAIANAGHGKTTLLQRIALYYCEKEEECDLNEKIASIYCLPDLPLIPCIVRLRSYSAYLSDDSRHNNESFGDFLDKAIRESIEQELSTYEKTHLVSVSGSVKAWLSDNTVRENLLLLIDGLDELSKTGRMSFLRAADDYLARHPYTKMILTSRVAGLSENGVLPYLESLGFRGRSIMPLSDRNARAYAELWIRKSCDSVLAENMLGQLDRVMTQSRYRYMREMMHSPLDLMVMLVSLSNGSMAPNRFKMFSDILRTRFTAHERSISLCEPIFTDTMMVLGLCAYRMQSKNVLSQSTEEIRELSKILKNYRFQSDVLGNADFEDCIAFFENLAANSGIIEREIRPDSDGNDTVHYTFPIRSYQECLTAYAVCHLCFSDDTEIPCPSKILLSHSTDKSWSGIINFAIADLSDSYRGRDELKIILEHIFSSSDDPEQLRGIIESNPGLSSDTARLLFEKRFATPRLSSEQREIIAACMSQSHYYAYEAALYSLYKKGGNGEFLEAYAYAAVLSRLGYSKPIYEDVTKRLKSDTIEIQRSGAAMVLELARLSFDRSTVPYANAPYKIDDANGICTLAYKALVPDRAITELLYKRAVESRELIFLEALSNLYPQNDDWSALVSEYIDEQLLRSTVSLLYDMTPKIYGLFDARPSTDSLRDTTELMYALGICGTVIGYGELSEVIQKRDVICTVKAVADTLSACPVKDSVPDRVSLAYARLLLGGTYEEFMQSFTKDVYNCFCETLKVDGNETDTVRFVKNPVCCTRERRFAGLIKEHMTPFATEYIRAQIDNMNTIPDIEAELFIERYNFERAMEKLKNSVGIDYAET